MIAWILKWPKRHKKPKTREGYSDKANPPTLYVSGRPNLPLLLDSVSSDDHHLRQIFDQPQCSFLSKLPAEVRTNIYGWLLGDRIIHLKFSFSPLDPREVYVFRMHKDIRKSYASWQWQWFRQDCIRSVASQISDHCEKDDCPHLYNYASKVEMFGTDQENVRWSARKIKEAINKLRIHTALLLACRKMYSEAIYVLYASNTFEFRHAYVLTYHLPRLLSVSNLANLRSIQFFWNIDYNDQPYPGVRPFAVEQYEEQLIRAKAAFPAYDSVWAALSALPGLQILRVTLETYRFWEGYRESQEEVPVDELRDAWLGPIDRLRGKTFTVFELRLGRSWIEQLWSYRRSIETPYSFKTAARVKKEEDEIFTLFARDDSPSS